MRKILLTIFLTVSVAASAQWPSSAPSTWPSQQPAPSADKQAVPGPDSLAARPQPAPQLDSALLGRSIYEVMPGSVSVVRSAEVQAAEELRHEYNVGHSVMGFRIRIFFDNSQQARSKSAATLEYFRNSFPDIPAFRTFENSYFKVTVGNYRTRTDANRALAMLKTNFPAAFIVEEKLKYPDF